MYWLIRLAQLQACPGILPRKVLIPMTLWMLASVPVLLTAD